jgi:hypothetical protein
MASRFVNYPPNRVELLEAGESTRIPRGVIVPEHMFPRVAYKFTTGEFADMTLMGTKSEHTLPYISVHTAKVFYCDQDYLCGIVRKLGVRR